MTINSEMCGNIQKSGYCGMCALAGEDCCPKRDDRRTGERRMRYERRTGYRREADANIDVMVTC